MHECRFAFGHTTPGHKCGNCGDFGHGRVECGNQSKIDNLKTYNTDRLPPDQWCSIALCRYPWSHINKAHHCSICGENHSSIDCDESSNEDGDTYNIECPICRTNNIIPTTQQKLFGITDQCSICMNATVEIFLPQCGHACLCVECSKKIQK